MQLLDSPEIIQPTFTGDRVLDSLEDIANKVQIKSDFCISHPDYKPLELPNEVAVRFQSLPLELRKKYLILRLRSFIYGIYYNGSLRKTLAPEADSLDLEAQQNLENNTYLGVDLKFYDRLHESNCGQGYFDPDWSVVKQEDDGTLAVTKGGLTLHIDRDIHLRLEDKSAAVGDLVAIRKPRNVVENGFYMAVGNKGSQRLDNSNVDSQTVEIYFNLSPEGAVAIMGAITRHLNEISIPFSFKALYNPSDYGRYDSAVLYFGKSNYETVRQVLTSVYAEQRSHFQTEVPLFTKFLAPGLALAEEPDRKFTAKESFGTHRCQIVANGLLEAWQNGDDSPDGRMASIRKIFSLLGIDLSRSYLNANSQDVYTALDLSY